MVDANVASTVMDFLTFSAFYTIAGKLFPIIEFYFFTIFFGIFSFKTFTFSFIYIATEARRRRARGIDSSAVP